MANIIQIKRSNATTIPASLAEGELAYSEKSDTKKLYIGTNGGAGIETIGGKAYVDQLDLVAQNTIKGRVTAGTGPLEELTPTQVRTLLNVEDGATGDMSAAEIEAIVSHDNLLDYVTEEHIDWTTDQSGTYSIHAGNITGFVESGWIASGDANTSPTMGQRIRHANMTATRTSTLPSTYAVGDGDIWIFNEDDNNDVTITPSSGDSIWFDGASLGTDTTYTLLPGELAILIPRTTDSQWAMMVVGSNNHTHTLADITDAGNLAGLDTVGTSQIDNNSVTYAKMQDISAQGLILGRNSAGAGDPEEINETQFKTLFNLEIGVDVAAENHSHTLADITDSGALAALDTVGTTEIDDNAVTLAKIQNIATASILGRVTASTGDPEVLTATQVRTLLNVEDGADVTDSTNVEAAGAVMETDTSTVNMQFVIDEDNMASNSATKVPTQQSVKAYVDASISSGIVYKGAYDASTNTPDLDTSPTGVAVGDMYTVTVAGTFFTTPLEVGDVLIAEVNDAAAEADWTIVQRNVDQATTTTLGLVELATDAETNTGTDTQRAITPSNLTAWTGSTNITTLGTIVTGTWQGSVISTAYIQNLSGTNTGDEPAASDTVAGIVELATIAETNTGTDATRAVTPDGLNGWTGSTNITTLGTITSGTWQGNAISGTYLPSASDTVAGIIEIATQTEVNTGTDTVRAVTPNTLANATLDGGTF